MEVKEEVRALLGPVAMQGQLGQVLGARQVSSQLRYASSCGLEV